MTTARHRRIVRRAVMAFAGVVLLPVWYVAAWLVVSRATYDGIISPTMAANVAVPLFPVTRDLD